MKVSKLKKISLTHEIQLFSQKDSVKTLKDLLQIVVPMHQVGGDTIETLMHSELAENLQSLLALGLPKDVLAELARPTIELSQKRMDTGKTEVESRQRDRERIQTTIQSFLDSDAVKTKITNTLLTKQLEIKRQKQIAEEKRDLYLRQRNWNKQWESIDRLRQVRNIPPVLEQFTGREEILGGIRTRFSSCPTTVLTQRAMSGLGGVGKTTTAIKYAHDHESEYVLIWFFRSETVETIQESVRELAKRLGMEVQGRPEDEMREEVMGFLESHPGWLLIYDNVEEKAILENYRPRSGGHVLVTSRLTDWESMVRVGEFTREESVLYLERVTGKMEPEAANKVSELLGDLPLVLTIAGKYISQYGYKEYLTQYELGGVVGSWGSKQEEVVARTWQITREKVIAEARGAEQIMKICSLMGPENIPLEVIRRVLEKEEEQVGVIGRVWRWMLGVIRNIFGKGGRPVMDMESMINPILRWSLMEADGEGVKMHRVLQGVLRGLISDAEKRRIVEEILSVVSNMCNDQMDRMRENKMVPEQLVKLIPHVMAMSEMEGVIDQKKLKKSLGNLFLRLGLFWIKEATIILGDDTNVGKRELYMRAIALDPNNSVAYNNLGSELKSGEKVRLESGEEWGARELYIRAIALDPNNSTLYSNLGCDLKSGEKVRLENGEEWGARELYIRAMALNPNNSAAHTGLGNVLKSGEKVRLESGKEWGKRELHIRAIALNPNNSAAHYNLGCDLKSGEKVRLENGEECGARELYIRAIALNPNNSAAHTRLGNVLKSGETVRLESGEEWRARELHIRAIALDPNNSTLYSNLGNELKSGEKVRLESGEEWGARELHIRAIALDPNNSAAYNNLGNVLKSGEKVRLESGEEWRARELHIRAIALDPNNSAAYNNLGNVLKSGEKVRLESGEECGARELYSRAIALNPNSSAAHTGLGNVLKSGEKVRLESGEEWGARELHIRAIALDPNNSTLYSNLGCDLKSGEKVRLENGEEWGARELYIRAMALNPNNSAAHTGLGIVLKSGEKVRLESGEEWGKRELHIRAIALNPNNSAAHYNLGCDLKSGEKVRLENGEECGARELYIRAIALNPNNSAAHTRLGSVLKSGETVRLESGEEWRARELHIRAIALDPNNSTLYYNLGIGLKAGEKVHLINGQEMTAADLYRRALTLNPEFEMAKRGVGKYVILLCDVIKMA